MLDQTADVKLVSVYTEIHAEVIASDAGGQKVRLLPVGVLLPR